MKTKKRKAAPKKRAARKTASRTLKLSQLRKAKACTEQVELFETCFGEAVEVSEALCLEHFDKFDWAFAAKAFLSGPAWAEYEHVTGPAWAEYKRIVSLARAEYKRVRGPALAEYNRVQAATFGRLYVAEGA